MFLRRRIDNRVQVLAAFMMMGAVGALIDLAVKHDLRAFGGLAFALWMSIRLWHVGCEQSDADEPRKERV